MKKSFTAILVLVFMTFAIMACSTGDTGNDISVTSSGVSGGFLADKYGAKGANPGDIPTLSPPLTIGNIPAGTVSLAVTMIDPDAGNFVHWLAANITPGDIAENASVADAANMVQGKNDFGPNGYGGPTPPNGTHTYVITVYALDANLTLSNGFSKTAFDTAIASHILGSGVLSAKYSK